jgi:hypothetical protein
MIVPNTSSPLVKFKPTVIDFHRRFVNPVVMTDPIDADLNLAPPKTGGFSDVNFTDLSSF